MNDHRNLIAELESQLADCLLLNSLSADPGTRFESRSRAIELHDRINDLREARPDVPGHTPSKQS
jgi:hypothetical protein